LTACAVKLQIPSELFASFTSAALNLFKQFFVDERGIKLVALIFYIIQ
jgi:hypothetical protein